MPHCSHLPNTCIHLFLFCCHHCCVFSKVIGTTGGEVESDRARLVAKVGAALADRSPEGVAQDLPEAVPLAELMMTCLSLGKASPTCFPCVCTNL